MTIKRYIAYTALPLLVLAGCNHAWAADAGVLPVSIKLLELQEELLQLTSKVNALSNDRNPDLSKPLKELTNRIGAVESGIPGPDEIPTLRAQLNEAKDRVARLEGQLEEVSPSADVSSLSDRLSARMSAFEAASRQSDEELGNRIDEVRASTPSRDQVASMTTRLSDTGETISGISTRLSAMEADTAVLTTRLKEVQSTVPPSGQITAIEQQLSDADTSIRTITQRTTAIQSEHEKLVARVEEQIDQLQGLEARIQTATAAMVDRIEQVDQANAALTQQVEAAAAAANAGDKELRTRLDRREIETQQAVKRLSRDLNRVELALRTLSTQQPSAPAAQVAATESAVASLRGEVRELSQVNVDQLQRYRTALETLELRVDQLAEAPIVRPVDIQELEQIVRGLRVEVGVLKANSPLGAR
ncbi:hypothetical protein JN531_016680 (plasmid) [Flagellatimonas centrodinii]|uniref:hypothetical protein n=1 Tax=Flagellatimonas centrodinii TaxID=2806210 RepID=UPI001FFA5466|nr:hypothetical protein [Flagellatimonas centrodinii]ULQ48413.1 hypothetical protein JN531_016680 [Flagellatimonas centrodinii]